MPSHTDTRSIHSELLLLQRHPSFPDLHTPVPTFVEANTSPASKIYPPPYQTPFTRGPPVAGPQGVGISVIDVVGKTIVGNLSVFVQQW
jgi:hypothetical protein